MACPHFVPQGPLLSWSNPPRVSLLEPRGGVCGITGESPGETALRENCNAGYASGRCPRLSAEDPDAVRFTAAERAGAPRVLYILEKEHVPVEFGWADETPPGSPVEAQGRAFLEAWLRRMGLHTTA